MVPWTFALTSADQLADFIEYHSHFLTKDETNLAEHALSRDRVMEAGKAALQARALDIGRATWGARQALAEFLREDGKHREYAALLPAVRPTTAVLMSRLLKTYPDASLDELMTVPEAAFALHNAERQEIAYLRPEIWITLWKDHGSSLQSSQYNYEREAAFFASRLAEERKGLSDLSVIQQQKQQDRLRDLEERVFLKGERVDISMWEN
jgi:hypothetical protein